MSGPKFITRFTPFSKGTRSTLAGCYLSIMKTHCVIKKNLKGELVERSLLRIFFAGLPAGARYRLTAEQFIERSTALNDYYWVLLCDYLQPALYDAGNDRIRTKEDAHVFFKKLLKIQSTQSLTDKEMLAYIESIHRYTAEFLGIALPSPNQKITDLHG